MQHNREPADAQPKGYEAGKEEEGDQSVAKAGIVGAGVGHGVVFYSSLTFFSDNKMIIVLLLRFLLFVQNTYSMMDFLTVELFHRQHISRTVF